MNTSEMNMKELTLDELEMADGGWSWKRAGKAAGLLGIVGAGCGAIIGSAAGPAGWCVLGGAVLLGGTCGAIEGSKE